MINNLLLIFTNTDASGSSSSSSTEKITDALKNMVKSPIFYIVTRKPTMFIVKDKDANHWNTFGQMCFDLHYHAYQPADVEEYIKNVVIAGNDTKAAEREQFYTDYLYPKDGVMPSQKIVDTIVNELNG